MSVLFSVTVSVSLAAAIFMLLKGRIAKRYGFGIIYILSLILAIRLIIPYSIQLPKAPVFKLVIPSYIPVLWAAGAVLCVLFQTGEYLYFRKTLLSDSTPASNEKPIADRVKKELFIDKEIPVLRSGKIGSPMLLGFGKPVIFLPAQDFTEAELLMIFRHELMHFKRGDVYKKLFFGAVAAVQWFNPFAWLLMRECSGSLEALCDREVTKNMDNSCKRDYCYLLLKTGKNAGKATAAGSYFSTKEMLKLRIDSVFDSGKKKRGGTLVVSSIVCLSLISSLLCSCTVETPQDVVDEMTRIESGVSNEKEQGVIDGENVSVTLHPVSEVTAAAKEEIAKIAAADGIFKFDDCNIIVPQVDSIPIYSENFLYGIETPQKIYEQVRELEKEWLGGNYYPDDVFVFVPYVYGNRGKLTIEKYLNSDKTATVYINRDNYDGEDYGEIETMINSLRLWSTPLLKSTIENGTKNGYLDRNTGKTINLFNPDEETLSRKLVFADGEITLGEAIKVAEDYMGNFRYRVDEKITYKVEGARIWELTNGQNVIDLYLRVYFDGFPLESIFLYSENDKLIVPFSAVYTQGTECMRMEMIRTDGFDQIMTFKTNTALTPTGKILTEIITLEDVFSILKNKLSNAVVYDVAEVSLGYIDIQYERADSFEAEKYYTHPVWNVTLDIGTQDLFATIDAVTGELYLEEIY